MMKIVVASMLIIVAFGATCKNPLFTQQQFHQHGLVMPKLLSSARIQDSAVFCPALQGEESCCSKKTLHQMDTAFRKYEEKVNRVLGDVMDKALARCDSLDRIDHADAAALESERSAVMTALDKSFDACHDAIIAYSRAMMCMGCSADKTEFVAEGKVWVNEASFGELQNACADLITQHKEFVEMANAHEEQLQTSCVKTTIALTAEKNSESIELCTANKEQAFKNYLSAVAESIFNKYEISETNLRAQYTGGKVEVCDTKGCEMSKISAEAIAEFDGLLEKKYNDLFNADAISTRKCGFTGLNERQDNCEEAIVRAATTGIFVDVESFFSAKTEEKSVVEFSDERAFVPIAVRAAASSSTNVTAELQAKLNGTNGVGDYFKSAAKLGASVLIVAFALLN